MPSEPGKKFTAGIIGGAGYAAGELIRLVRIHPNFTLEYVQSKSQCGRPVTSVHGDMIGETDLTFTDRIDPGVDLLFLAQGPGDASKLLDSLHLPAQTRVIDLSQDFRFSPSDTYRFIYGLPEANQTAISEARYIANPGCFATAILLALIPFATGNFLQDPVHISAITGSTGAGQSLSDTLHFSWRYSNISIYKPFEHQHLHEVNGQLGEIMKHAVPPIHFIPMRGNFTRGILASLYTRTDRSLSDILADYHEYYQNAPFIFITDTNPDLKMVINTNKCLLYLKKHKDMLLIISIIDNLIKGAAGQAIQNMNLMFGLSKTAGLRLKASVF